MNGKRENRSECDRLIDKQFAEVDQWREQSQSAPLFEYVFAWKPSLSDGKRRGQTAEEWRSIDSEKSNADPHWFDF